MASGGSNNAITSTRFLLLAILLGGGLAFLWGAQTLRKLSDGDTVLIALKRHVPEILYVLLSCILGTYTLLRILYAEWFGKLGIRTRRSAALSEHNLDFGQIEAADKHKHDKPNR